MMGGLLRVTLYLWLLCGAGVVLADYAGEVLPGVPSLAYTRLDLARTHIYLADVEGRTVRITQDGQAASQPAWSPDGADIAYVAPNTDTRQIYLLRGLEGEPVQLTSGLAESREPRWLPEGERLLFLFERTAGRRAYDVFTLEIETGTLRNLTDDNPNSGTAVPSPDGETVAYQFDNRQVRVVELPYGAPVLEAQNGTRSPAWSPDGRRLAYVGPQDRFVSSVIDTIYVHPMDDSDLTRYSVADLTEVDHPAWSPDGARIAFVGQALANRGVSVPVRQRSVHVLELETGTVRQLTEIEGWAVAPVWSPDGRYVMFVVLQPEVGNRICFYAVAHETTHCPVSLTDVFDRPMWRPAPAG